MAVGEFPACLRRARFGVFSQPPLLSLTMLTDAIGIAPPSLYSAFGSKAGLYREALDRYAIEASLTLVEDHAQNLTLNDALDRMFERAITLVVGHGCMISTGLLTSHPDHHALTEELAARRGAMTARFAQDLEHWLPRTHADTAARFLCATLQGMAVQARDGAGVHALSSIAAIARLGVLCSVKQTNPS
ncbi:TetR/AcrR family transcriptional regulator [Paracoccus sp. Ld10]|uniref:TetR/AcrR family transcriptional regulator n=1 Tax=Paracoccus sp. Ld10 TaxID=649158 RepID=UPI0038639646